MNSFHHSHVDVLKMDVEGAEVPFLKSLFDRPSLMATIGQFQFEFHRVDMLKRFTASLVGRGFRLIHARVNDRCGTCTEVAFQSNSTP